MESGKPGKTSYFESKPGKPGKNFNCLEFICILENISLILIIFYCTEIFPS